VYLRASARTSGRRRTPTSISKETIPISLQDSRHSRPPGVEAGSRHYSEPSTSFARRLSRRTLSTCEMRDNSPARRFRAAARRLVRLRRGDLALSIDISELPQAVSAQGAEVMAWQRCTTGESVPSSSASEDLPPKSYLKAHPRSTVLPQRNRRGRRNWRFVNPRKSDPDPASLISGRANGFAAPRRREAARAPARSSREPPDAATHAPRSRAPPPRLYLQRGARPHTGEDM
jgi:hypothetical protein